MSLKYALAVQARITDTKWLEKQVQHLAAVAPREAALARGCCEGLLGQGRSEREEARGKGSEPVMGGNGRESRFCVCAPLLPRKTRPQRRWDLISARRHSRKLVLLGKGAEGLACST